MHSFTRKHKIGGHFLTCKQKISLTVSCLFPWRLSGAGRFSQDHPKDTQQICFKKKFCFSLDEPTSRFSIFFFCSEEIETEALQMWGLMIKRQWGGLESWSNARSWCVCVCVCRRRDTNTCFTYEQSAYERWMRPTRFSLSSSDAPLAESQRIGFLGDAGVCIGLCMALLSEIL